MRVLKWIGGGVLAVFLVLFLFVVFGLNLLKGPVERAVSKATERELVIKGDLRAVWSWVHPRIRAEGVTFANAEWGSADYMLDADAVEASVSLLPLFAGRVVIPEVHLENAGLSLEMDADGRKNWVFKDDPEEQKKESRFTIKLLTVDQGRLNWVDGRYDTSLVVDLETDESGVTFAAEGKWLGMDSVAKGHAGHVLSIRDRETPFPLKAEIRIGDTKAKLDGTLTSLIGFKGIDLQFHELSGKTMEELYWIVGLAFPDTSPYRLSGRLFREDGTWRFEKFSGKVGESDLAGTLQVDTGKDQRPYMHGEMVSKVLNFADLGPLVGTQQPRESGVLPDAPFHAERWDSVDTDVRLRAGTIKRPDALPIDNLNTRIRMRDSVLNLDPLEFGIAGGKLAGTIRIDGNKDPIPGVVNMRVRGLQLAKLFPTIEQAQGSVGDLNGLVEIAGTGDSVGKMLASANGKVGIYMDDGKISRFLMELVALDLWDAVRVKMKGDREIDIRCAIADFGVKGGVMQANALVFDTTVVNVSGEGTINLTNEAMDLKLNPKPKDSGIGSLRTPLHVRGTFSAPKVGPDMGRLAARGGGALALGILNPLLAIIPLLEEGKGKDSNCSELIAQATTSTKTAAKPKPAAEKAVAEKPAEKRAVAGKPAEKPAVAEKPKDRPAAAGRTAPTTPPER